jgi:hypothetical protein
MHVVKKTPQDDLESPPVTTDDGSLQPFLIQCALLCHDPDYPGKRKVKIIKYNRYPPRRHVLINGSSRIWEIHQSFCILTCLFYGPQDPQIV